MTIKRMDDVGILVEDIDAAMRVDVSRGVLILTKTKSGKDREVPMNPEVFEILSAVRKQSIGRGYVFINPQTGER